MAAITDDDGGARGEEALKRLRSTDPLLYLSPSAELSSLARTASIHLFSSLVPLCPKSPFDRLLAGDGFDAEQIWGQIDSLSRPLLSTLRRNLNRLQHEPISDGLREAEANAGGSKNDEKIIGEGNESREDDNDDDEEEAFEEDEGDEDEDEGEEDEAEEDEEDEDDEMDAEEEDGNNVEDRFLKIKEMKEYMEKDEEEEYGQPKQKLGKEDDNEEDEDEDGEDEDELEFGSDDGDNNEETVFGESARYEDFFGTKKKKGSDKKNGNEKEKGSSKSVKFVDDLGGSDMDDEQKEDGDVKVLSTHEKHIQKIHSKIEEMEKANLETKSWLMQGEVTAHKRPKDSALEVYLDFEHNTRPAPAITEEVTASLEDLIKKRIIEGNFDDVQKAPALPSKAPKELKEMDENKSKKGLAEIYEEEYAQKTGLASIPLSSSDEQKKEASILFKNLCLKLDALAHFHFAPKPIIEEMSIQVNAPALAMEEIAPLAVSDVAMLAPEEIFEGKGDIKEEVELTQEDRKRRRANKKRKFKAESARKDAKKTRLNVATSHPSGMENS